MTYDAADGYVVLFGGLSPNGTLLAETWTFHAGVWKNLNLTSNESPPARAFASITYDAADGVVLLFGGLNQPVASNAAKLNDTWEFHGGNWVKISTNHAPSRRFAASMAFDAADGYVLLLGGNSTIGPSADTWTFLGGVWTKLALSSAPSPRYGAAMTYFPGDNGSVVLMDGMGARGVYTSHPLNWTWGFIGGKWTHSGTASFLAKPIDRFGAVMASSSNKTILVGGAEFPLHYSDIGAGLGPGQLYAPFYLHSYLASHGFAPGSAQWQSQLNSAHPVRFPPASLPSQFPGFAWDASDGYFVLFLDGQTWTTM
jgi:hypothetical protein